MFGILSRSPVEDEDDDEGRSADDQREGHQDRGIAVQGECSVVHGDGVPRAQRVPDRHGGWVDIAQKWAGSSERSLLFFH